MLFKRTLHSSYIFQHIIENMHDGVLTVDYSGMITTVNLAAETILEMKRKDLLHKKYSDIFVHYPENDDFNQIFLDAIYESSMSHHKICNFYTGEKVKALFVTTSLLKIKDGAESKSAGVTILFSDVTELQELREAAVAMDKIKQLNRQLERLSYLDSLTGLPNRRYFEDILNREWRRALRENTSLSVLMLDIDYFKQLNDTFGHHAGDECLKAVAETLNKNLRRAGDLVARLGGDEFVVILPETDETAARMVAEVMRQKVVELNIQNPASPFGMIAISIGLACQKPSLDSHPGNLIKAADEALYRGKHKGRNIVSA